MASRQPVVHLHLVPEESAPGKLLVDAGAELHFTRFDDGMEDGRTAIGVAILLPDEIQIDTRFIADGHDTFVIVQTSLDALRTAMAALEAAEAKDAYLRHKNGPPIPVPIDDAEEANHGRPRHH
jgi:hypothetical protein